MREIHTERGKESGASESYMQAAPPWALRSSAALAPGLAMPRAPATELVFWHRVSDCAPKGCGLLFLGL